MPLPKHPANPSPPQPPDPPCLRSKTGPPPQLGVQMGNCLHPAVPSWGAAARRGCVSQGWCPAGAQKTHRMNETVTSYLPAWQVQLAPPPCFPQAWRRSLITMVTQGPPACAFGRDTNSISWMPPLPGQVASILHIFLAPQWVGRNTVHLTHAETETLRRQAPDQGPQWHSKNLRPVCLLYPGPGLCLAMGHLSVNDPASDSRQEGESLGRSLTAPLPSRADAPPEGMMTLG